MGISTDKLLGLGQVFNQAGTMYAAPGTSQAAFNDRMGEVFSTQQQAQAMKKAKEEEEKKRKSGLFGSIGSTLGTIAGIALAPVTGGASLAIPALAGAAGGAIGGTVGNLVGGGGFNPQQSLMYGAQGAMGGLTAGMMAPAAAGAGTYTGAKTATGLFDPIGKFTPAASNAMAAPAATGFGSKLFNNPNIQGFMRSQMQQQMPMQGLSSMFQPVQGGLYMNKNNMANTMQQPNPYSNWMY